MSAYTKLQTVASLIAELSPELESLNMCANFLRRKLDNPEQYPTRSLEQLTSQFLFAEARVNAIRLKLNEG